MTPNKGAEDREHGAISYKNPEIIGGNESVRSEVENVLVDVRPLDQFTNEQLIAYARTSCGDCDCESCKSVERLSDEEIFNYLNKLPVKYQEYVRAVILDEAGRDSNLHKK